MAPPNLEPTAPSPAIVVRDLEHAYDGQPALRGIGFEVARGELFALLGPNGGGKTTLFRILSTLLVPQSGHVSVLGTDLRADRAAARRHLGVVFQAPALDRKLTVRENLRHQGHLYGLRGGTLERRIDAAVERFGLADRRDRLVEGLSGGQRRRVDIAKGLLHGPAVLLLDEPSTGLDPGARRDLTELLLEIRARDGVTVLLTTHILDEAERCDRVAILDEGRLVALGAPHELKGQVGGDVLSIQARDPAAVARALLARTGRQPVVLESLVRLEGGAGPELVRQLLEELGGEVEALTLSKPTLEDVFIHCTGHRLGGGEGQ